MTFLEYLTKTEQFVFGHWSPLVGTILVFVAITFLWDCYYKKPPIIGAVKALVGKLAAYITFFAVGHQLDRLFANSLLEFEGATQFFVAMYVLVKEVKYILAMFRHLGVEVPWILQSRTKVLEDVMKGMGPPTNENIDSKIKELKESIEKLKALQDAGQQPGVKVRDVFDSKDNPEKRD